MFAAQHGSHRVSPSPDLLSEEERASGMARDDSDSDDDEHPSFQSTSSVVPTRANSISPKPIERAPAGHRRSSTFGNQPWTTIHENATPVILVEHPPPTLSHKPLSFDDLNTALAGAHEEVKVLRQQYDNLQTLVSNRLGMETRDEAKSFPSTMDSEKVVPEKDNGGVVTGSQAQLTAAVPPAPAHSGVPTEIADLSEIEAKRALTTLARSLNLPLDVLVGLSNAPGPTSQQALSPSNLHDVASIGRAVKFLGTIDELVWRRSSAPSGPRTLSPVSSEENITALVARLELWERTIRRSART
ncbi:hypothetical protein JVU11DRAFT_11819 [Chiua virens]|nr:hypothetical protein JVU11DRAFT_11819 [Chiua virens]